MAIVLDGTNGVTTNSGTLISATTIGVGGATPSTSGAGITFPATVSASSDANTLDDYEEGDWTPAVKGASTAGTATYGSRSGKYVKIGSVVHVWFAVNDYSLTGAAGSLEITGLPFSPSGTGPTFTPGTAKTYNIDFTGDYIIAQTYDTTTSVYLLGIRDANTWVEVPIQNVGNLYVIGQITYRV
jgi:hypothetical protein